MGKALYRKYRPKNLDQVVGQSHITDTLSRAIKSGKFSHAYLLTGPRGTGKTSIARILAHELNGIEYDEEQSQLDIIEIDAASNRRIDEIRDLRDKVHILPTSNKFKVYIIDEVHMLTREAFNALLKTLEEPPAHVIFILATTEAHKLPETIVSRTQHFAFKPVEQNKVVEHLTQIAKGEKLDIEPTALELVAKHGGGSFRDSISLLDQVRNLGDKVTEKDVAELLGVAPTDISDGLIESVFKGDVSQTMSTLSNLYGDGYSASILAKQLGEAVRAKILEDNNFQTNEVLQLLDNLLNIASSPYAERSLEIALLSYIFANNPRPISNVLPKTTESSAKATTITKTTPTISKETVKTPKEKDAPARAEQPPKPKSENETKEEKEVIEEVTPKVDFTLEAWPVVIAAIKKKYNTIYGILRMAEPNIQDGVLILGFKFPFHQKQMNNAKNKSLIGDVIKEQTGQNIEISCVIIQKEGKNKQDDTKNNIVNNVSDIFGGAEVIES